MKRTNFSPFSLFVIILFYSVLSQYDSYAALTKQLSYQGRLQNASGQPVANGTYSIVFSIYNVSSGGSALWTETQNVSVESGGFSAYLGSVTPLTLPFNEDYYLGIKVGSDPEMMPRMKLAVVGTAAFALESDKLQGKAASDFALSTHNHDSNYSASAHTHTATGVTQIVAGSNVTISPSGGTGVVTINATGGGGSSLTPASTVQPVTSASVVGTSLNYAREDHQHNMVSNFITDSMVSSSAAIATSKLSGTVTAISGNGLGSLATLNTVSSAQITDNTIALVDLAVNGCTSGQIMKYNGTAWQCDADISGGGTPASSVTTIGGSNIVGTSGNFAREDHVHSIQANFIDNSMISPTANIAYSKLSMLNSVTSSDMQDLSVVNADISNSAAIAYSKLSLLNSVTGSDIQGSTITDANIAAGANIAYSKLSLLNSIGTADISNSTLQFGDFASNGCGSGQVMEYNGTAWICGTDDTGAGGVSLTPGANQIIQPTADIIPLIIRDDAASTAFLFDIQNNAGTTLVRVNETGNLLVGNPATTTAKVSAEETGTANYAGFFKINNATNANHAVFATTSGIGAAGYFDISNASNSDNAVFAITVGTGSAGDFEIGNATNSNPALYVTTNGSGSSASFNSTTGANGAPLIIGNHAGIGNLLELQQGGTIKFTVDNTGDVVMSKAGTSLLDVKDAGNTVFNITNSLAGTASLQVEGATVLTSANGVITNPSALQTIQPTADIVPLVIKDDAASTANLFDIQNNGGTSLVKVNPTGNLLVGSPVTTTAKVSAEETGTTNYAGYFEVINASNTATALVGKSDGGVNSTAITAYHSGLGNPISISATNASNAKPLIFGNDNGTGNLLQLQQGGVDKFVVDNTGAITVGSASDPNAVNLSPSGLQTLQATVDIVPLVIKDDVVATTADLLDIQSSASTSLVKVNPSGNLLVGSPTTTTAKVSAYETGTANHGGYFQINNATNAGYAVYGSTTGTGYAGLFQINSASNGANAVYGSTTGIGNAAYFVITNSSSSGNAVRGNTSGSGNAVYGETTGSGYAVYGNTTGTGVAGNFNINNVGNSTSVIKGNTTGTGSLLQLQQGGVDKFVVNNAGNITTVGTALVTGLNADKVDGYDATSFAQFASMNTATTALPLFQLNQNGGAGGLLQMQYSGVDQFTVAQNGKIGFSTGANKAVGLGTVAAATACLTVANTSVTNTSIILVTINSANTGTDIEALKVKNIVNGTSFDVCTVKESVGHTLGINFNYMIMN